MAEVKMSDPVADQLRSQYPSNSIVQKPKEPEREKVKPVIKGKVSLQQEPFGKKIRKMFFKGDISDICDYAINQLIIPGLKSGALTIMEMMLFGSVSKRYSNNLSSGTNYHYISSGGQKTTIHQSVTQKDKATHNFKNIIFQSYQDAEDVISTMLDLLDRYGSVTVANFYDAAQIEADWAAYDWGWTSFQKLEARRIKDGYIIDMQPPIYLKGV